GPGGGGAGARRVEAVLQLLLQNEGEEAAGDVAADRFVQLVIDWPRLEQTFRRAKGSFHGPQLFVDEHRLERREMRIGLQHEHAVEFLVLLDLGAVDGEAVAHRVGEETAVSERRKLFICQPKVVRHESSPPGGLESRQITRVNWVQTLILAWRLPRPTGNNPREANPRPLSGSASRFLFV